MKLKSPRPAAVLATAFCLVAALAGCASDEATSSADEATASPLQKAIALIGEADFSGAVELLVELTSAEPENGQAWLQLARAHRNNASYAEAVAAAQKAATLAPVRGQALQSIFLAHVEGGDLDSALESYESLRGVPPNDLSGLHLATDLAPLQADPRFAALFPEDFDEALVEPHSIVQDWRGEGVGEVFGWEARNVGDVDGDGADDAVISAPGIAAGNDAAGTVYVYSGATGRELGSRSGEAGDQFGMGIESAGDVDGDGVPDVVAGAPGAGRAYVFSGANGDTLHTFAGTEEAASFGSTVAGAGDVDADGHADLLVGSPGAAAGAGRVFLYSGADGSVLLEIEGEEGEALGSVVAGGIIAGRDLEGTLLIVGAPGGGPEGKGRVLVYRDLSGEPDFVIDAVESGRQLGAMFASAVGDINGDGHVDVYASDWADSTLGPSTGRIYVHSGADGSRLLTLSGEASGDGFGIGPARAGDVDGDGYDDLVIGAWQHSSAAHSGGKVYVYSGKDADVLWTFTGKVPGETLGFDADGIGDVNGDGRPDFLVTSAYSLVEGVRSGRTLIVSPGP